METEKSHKLILREFLRYSKIFQDIILMLWDILTSVIPHGDQRLHIEADTTGCLLILLTCIVLDERSFIGKGKRKLRLAEINTKSNFEIVIVVIDYKVLHKGIFC